MWYKTVELSFGLSESKLLLEYLDETEQTEEFKD